MSEFETRDTFGRIVKGSGVESFAVDFAEKDRVLKHIPDSLFGDETTTPDAEQDPPVPIS